MEDKVKLLTVKALLELALTFSIDDQEEFIKKALEVLNS